MPITLSSLRFASLALSATIAHAFDHSHAAFDQVLRTQVRDGLVNYAALKAAPRPLDDYLDQLAAVPAAEFAGWAERDRLAFLINLYNAATLKLIIAEYPVKSIRSIGWIPGSAWKRKFVRFTGRTISLDEVEHGIIRQQYPDARVHFALVCAARGCPILRSEAYSGAKLNAQLDEQGRGFLGDPVKNRVDAATRTAHLSPIFKWFSGDFEASAGSVLKFAAPFFPAEARRALAAGDFKVRHTDYDWSLNEQPGK